MSISFVRDDNIQGKNRYAIFKCSCGNEFRTQKSRAIHGGIKSCKKCSSVANATTHNLSKTKLINTWSQMKQRCYNKKNSSFKYYGNKGISICDEWVNDFESFYTWSIANGYSVGLSIDRIDSSGNYEPSNCRWVTLSENVSFSNKDRIVNRGSNGRFLVTVAYGAEQAIEFITKEISK